MTKGADIIAAYNFSRTCNSDYSLFITLVIQKIIKRSFICKNRNVGEKVVISGGAFVLPIIHNITQVGMRTLSIKYKKSR